MEAFLAATAGSLLWIIGSLAAAFGVAAAFVQVGVVAKRYRGDFWLVVAAVFVVVFVAYLVFSPFGGLHYIPAGAVPTWDR